MLCWPVLTIPVRWPCLCQLFANCLRLFLDSDAVGLPMPVIPQAVVKMGDNDKDKDKDNDAAMSLQE